MFDNNLINQVVSWERRLQIEAERHKNLRGEPYVDEFTAPQPRLKERQSFFARVFKRRGKHQPGDSGYAQKPCPEVQPGC